MRASVSFTLRPAVPALLLAPRHRGDYSRQEATDRILMTSTRQSSDAVNEDREPQDTSDSHNDAASPCASDTGSAGSPRPDEEDVPLTTDDEAQRPDSVVRPDNT